ncbi:MucR family transcriptional regulator [Sphingomonas sp. 22R3R2A-7]|uniref:MucR family transcriptional regulator n=1 Tax=Sphingomonas sp. 22R3R2A-7 TaxID=3050230 RepID=UPI002FE2DC0F
MTDDHMEIDAIELATELTAAWLSNPNTRASADEIPIFLSKMHHSIKVLNGAPAATTPDATEAVDYTPAVSARKSLANPEFIISMIDGKPYKTLRRHLSTKGLSPAEYRQRYGLKADYPMVAANYSEARRAMAHKIGLGSTTKKAAKAATPAAAKRKGEPKAD